MKNQFRRLALLPLLVLAGGAVADLSDMPSGTYGLDDHHAYITFSYSHMGYSTPHVGFNSFDASLTLDADNPEMSSVMVNIDATSIDSRVDDFDDHLSSPDFFDTAKHPEITFQSTSMSKTGDNTFAVVGDLTIKGITKPVTLDATIIKAEDHPRTSNPTIGMTGEARVMRSDWGLDRAVPMVGDEVTITLTAEMPFAGKAN